VGKGAFRAVPTILSAQEKDGGHASLCPPYGSSRYSRATATENPCSYGPDVYRSVVTFS